VYSTLLFFLWYSNPLLRRRRWTGILRWGVLGYVVSLLLFLWCYGVFRYSVSLRVIIVLRDIIYVIIILYSWHLVICVYFWPYMWNNWSWVMHTMSPWFWQKNGYGKTVNDLWVTAIGNWTDCWIIISGQTWPPCMNQVLAHIYHDLPRNFVYDKCHQWTQLSAGYSYDLFLHTVIPVLDQIFGPQYGWKWLRFEYKI
jgi:hypothetical protein